MMRLMCLVGDGATGQAAAYLGRYGYYQVCRWAKRICEANSTVDLPSSAWNIGRSK